MMNTNAVPGLVANMNRLAAAVRARAFLVVPTSVLLLLLWLPFGFSIGALIEEWDVLGYFTTYGTFFWSGADTPLMHHRLRPLTATPQAIAFWLDQNSFYYWHLMLIGALLLKGIAASWLAWWLTRSKLSAILFGTLLIVYPADTMQLAFRSLHINWSVALGLTSIVLCIAACEAKSRVRSALLASAAGSLLILGTWAYEALLLFVAVPPLMFFARDGLFPAIRRVRSQPLVWTIWLAAALFSAVYIVSVLMTTETYQASVVGTDSVATKVLGRAGALLNVGVARALVGGWLDAASAAYYEYRNYRYVVGSSIVLILTGALLCKQHERAYDNLPRRTIRVMAAGLAILILGYLPFLLSPHHLITNQRTFLFATPGACLVVLAVLMVVGRLHRRFSMALGSALVLLGFCAQMYQFKHYSDISAGQRSVLASVVKAVPSLAPDQALLIIDGSERINNLWMLTDNIASALTYAYAQPIGRVFVCSGDGAVWQHYDQRLRRGVCEEKADQWEFRQDDSVTGEIYSSDIPPVIPVRVAKKQLVVVRISPDGTATSNEDAREHRTLLRMGNDPLSRRYRGALLPYAWPFDFQQFRVAGDQQDFRWDFGRWWSMDTPVVGAGWRAPEWRVDGWKYQSYAWKQEPVASLLFQLSPTHTDYVLEGNVVYMNGIITGKDIQVRLNGHVVDVHWENNQAFTASVPATALRRGRNMIEFDSAINTEYFGLSFALDWLRLHPAPKAGNS